MANEGTIVLVGNATADSELKFGASGTARCTWNLAVTTRVKQNDSWTDGETAYYRCTAWRQVAENAGESVTRGMRLVVVGRLSPRSYEANGEKRVSLDVEVEHVAADMRYHTVKATKVDRGGGGGSAGSGGGAADPWASSGDQDSAPF